MTTLRQQLLLAAYGTPTKKQDPVTLDVNLDMSGNQIKFGTDEFIKRITDYELAIVDSLGDYADLRLYYLYVHGGIYSGNGYINVLSDMSMQAGKNFRVGSGGALFTDTITEITVAAGVTVDGVKMKDGTPRCDTIFEATSDAGVTIDGTLLKDGRPRVDVIMEKTLDHGVTVDHLNIKDYDLPEAGDITGLAGKTVDFPNVDADQFKVAGVNGVDGTFTSQDGKTVTVTKGLITSIV